MSKSRAEILGAAAQVPHVDAGMYLIECALECGSTEWGTIRAWADSVDVEFSPWEFRLMRELFGQYKNAMHDGRQKNATAPYRAGQVVNKQAVADQVRRALRGG